MSYNPHDRHPDLAKISRIDVINELHAAEARLRITRCDLAKADDAAERARLRERVSRLKTAVQRIRIELARRAEQRRIEDAFVRLAYQRLDRDVYESLYQAASAAHA